MDISCPRVYVNITKIEHLSAITIIFYTSEYKGVNLWVRPSG